jgi:hypothetical protein
MRKTKNYFEQVPLALAKQIALEEDAGLSSTRQIPCAICGVPIELEHCKINEDGQAVHDKCYFAKVKPPPKFGT